MPYVTSRPMLKGNVSYQATFSKAIMGVKSVNRRVTRPNHEAVAPRRSGAASTTGRPHPADEPRCPAGRHSDFQHGFLRWNAATGAVALAKG